MAESNDCGFARSPFNDNPTAFTVQTEMSSAATKSNLARAIGYGVASVALYFLLIAYADETVELAHRTREGEKVWFLVPIVIAFVFSLVHGAFTGAFWAAVGLKPAGKARKKPRAR
jgi:hypothetical protein